MKRCAKCGELKELSEFTKHARRPDGLQGNCNPCQRAAVRDDYWRDPEYYGAKARRRNASRDREFRSLLGGLKSVPCSDCGGLFLPCAMHFDHTQGAKLFDIGQGVRRNPEIVLAEIRKCEVVCANCHAERTYQRRMNEPSLNTPR